MLRTPGIKSSSVYGFAKKLFYSIKFFGTKIGQPPAIYQDKTGGLDHSVVSLYPGADDYWPFYPIKNNNLIAGASKNPLKVSLISAVKNEIGNVEQWFEAIRNQSRLPDEIILVDGGSTDGTKKSLEKCAATFPIPLRIYYASEGNIAKSRNLAIRQATHPIITVIDFGCIPNKDWLEKTILPFELDETTQVSAGVYNPIFTNQRAEKNKKLWAWVQLSRIRPQEYLPPGGAIAFCKDAWAAVGGYPEWLTLTGEDTYFDLELKRLGGNWAFVPGAVVNWYAPESMGAYLKKMYRWAIGDGEAGMNCKSYWKNVLRLFAIFGSLLVALAGGIIFGGISIFASVLWFCLCFLSALLGSVILAKRQRLPLRLQFIRLLGEIAQQAGFIKGARRRKIIDQKRFELVKGVYFILSGIPIDDTGGGARGTQIALELLNLGYVVIFIHKYPRYEKRDLNLNFKHLNLIVQNLTEFDWADFARDYSTLFEKPLAAIVESPMADFLPILEHIRKWNGVVTYDLLDAWDTSLGMDWYSLESEKKVIETSHLLVATAPVLQKRLEKISFREVKLIPNAVNERLFDPILPHPQPMDLPRAEWNIIYSGALWGEWFDWELLRRVAEGYPEAAVTVIGDYRNQYKHSPKNLHFLGLKPQRDLPAYLAHGEVAIIPWKVNKITQATSPLKVFEYVAMKKPVIAPALPALQEIPGVFLAQDQDEFVDLVGRARSAKLDTAAMSAFVKNNNWQNRVEKIVNFVNQQSADARTETVYNQFG